MSELSLFDSAASPSSFAGDGEPASPVFASPRDPGVKDTGPIGPGPRLPAADSGAARWSDPITSHQAAARPGKKRHRELALVELFKAGAEGLTDFELAGRTAIAQTSIGKRRGELRDEALVEATPDMRPAPSGSPARVWVITQDGITIARSLLISNHAPEASSTTNERSGLQVPEVA